MRRRPPPSTAALLGIALAALLAGCGGGTKTVTAASTPLPEQTSSTSAPPPSTAAPAPATTATSPVPAPSSSGGTSAPSTTRTATAPAFTSTGSGSASGSGAPGTSAEGQSAAEAVLRGKGFTVGAASDYHPDQTLRVLIGTRTGSAEGAGQQAFFFVDGHYIGTDAKQPSASISVMHQGDTEVKLAYSLKGGGRATVSFQLNNGKLVPLEPIPPARSRQ